MKYLPWIIGGAAVGYFARRGTGRRTTNSPFDQTTGEPLPPYAGRGRPRDYNSLETKRVGVLARELQGEFNKLREGGHTWKPTNLAIQTSVLFTIANDLQTHPVCDGKIVFRDKPGPFTRNRYACEATPGTTGKRMLYNSWKGRQGGLEAQRKKREKAAREKAAREAG